MLHYFSGFSGLPSLFLSFWITQCPLASQPHWAHSGNNLQSICALERHTGSFKYCPQPLLYFSVSIIIPIYLMLYSLDLTILPPVSVLAVSLICVFTASLTSFISPTLLTDLFSMLFVQPILRAQGWAAGMPGCSDLLICVCGPSGSDVRAQTESA